MSIMIVIAAKSLPTSCQILPQYTFSHLEEVVREQPGRDDLSCSYFREGFSYNEIVLTLLHVHGISLCLRQLKRILARLGLKRKFSQEESPIETIVSASSWEICLSMRQISLRERVEIA